MGYPLIGYWDKCQIIPEITKFSTYKNLFMTLFGISHFLRLFVYNLSINFLKCRFRVMGKCENHGLSQRFGRIKIHR